MSQFDPETFLDSATTEAGAEQMTNVPEGEYNAVIDEIRPPRTVIRRDGSTAYVWDIPCRIDAPGNELADGRPVRYSIWLDLTDTGALDFGENKNVKLGALRAACGQNEAGREWNPRMLVGQPIRVNVKHSDDGRYADVSYVGKPA